MSTVEVRRSRRVVPLPPGGELALEPPPEPERPVPAGPLGRLLPLVMLLGSVAFVALGPTDGQSRLFGGMFALSTVGMLFVGGGGRSAGQRQAALDEQRRDYLRYLAIARRRVRAVAAEQRAALEHVHPDPAGWPAVVAAGRLWERRGGDPDFGRLRLGRGTQRLATRLVAPQTGPVDAVEPVCALALRRFLRGHSVVADLPIALALRASSTVWLEPAPGAGPGAARALARALVAQYVLWHGPDDALLAVVAPPYLAAEWEWVKWLPHVGHARWRDAIGPLRTVTAEADDVRRWWSAELAGRPAGTGVGEPHLLVVVDDAVGPGPWAGVVGTTVLRVGAPPGRRPGPAVVRLAVGCDGLGRVDLGGAVAAIGQPDALTVADATALARRLARFRPAGAAAVDAGPRRSAGLPALLGLPAAGPIDAAAVAALRGRRGGADRLRVPIGLDETGAPVALDIKESAQGGSGPHGLCIGATGSGKSELLRTLVLGLAATHSSAELNLVLVDFKGGATFLGLAGLPHVAAVITNLADELTLVDRMADALSGEITRRQELLRAAGNLTGVTEYAAAHRAAQGRLPPLPALLVVVDEFSELLARRPELVDLLGTIGRLGRSLGLHLLLASQRLDEGRLRGLESHLSYRIALRTFSAAESRAVLGVPDAHQLPSAPGSAFLSTGTDELVRFRAAYVSGPAQAGPSGGAAVGSAPRRAYVFRAGPVGAAAVPSARPGSADRPEADPDAGPDGPSVLDTMIAAMVGHGPPAHRVWLPPLDVPPPLDELLGAPRPVADRGLAAPLRLSEETTPPGRDSSVRSWQPGALRVAVALVDRPYQQRRDALLLDLADAAGHLAVVGGPRAGKSGGLRTVVLALALTHTPAELGVHVLDFGGGALAALAGLPHVGTVVDRQQPDVVRRIVAELASVLARRERLFRDAGIGSVEEFRVRRAAGEFSAEPATDLLLVVDGYLVLRGEFDDLEARLLPLAAQGLSYGLHLALSANRWSELRPALKDLLGSRLELRLGEPSESEVDRRRAAAVPARPGHGLAPDGAPMVMGAPWTSGATRDTGGLVAAVAAAWPGRRMAPVALLPELLDIDDLPRDHPDGGAGIGIGVDEDGLARVEVDLTADPHLVCFADAESGKTTLLRVLARALTRRYTPQQARIVVVDYRRGLLGAVPESHLIGYAGTADAAAVAARDVAASLRARLPGPGVGARELRERSWWTGPEVYVLIDDYDLVAPAGGAAVNPLLPLAEFLPQAKDVGLHVVLTRRSGGAGRALFDPLLGRLRELAVPGLVMNGSPDEGALVGTVKARPSPPGRGTLVDRRRGNRRVQLGWLAPDAEPAGEPGAMTRVAVQVGAAWLRVAADGRLLAQIPVAQIPAPGASLSSVLAGLFDAPVDELIVVHAAAGAGPVPDPSPTPVVTTPAAPAEPMTTGAGTVRAVPAAVAAAQYMASAGVTAGSAVRPATGSGGPGAVVVDVGHGGAEVALVRAGRVVTARRLAVGGARLDAVTAAVLARSGVAVGPAEARRVREALSLLPEVRAGTPPVVLSADELRAALAGPLQAVVQGVRDMVTQAAPGRAPPVLLIGGVARTPLLAELLDAAGVGDVRVTERPDIVAVLGALRTPGEPVPGASVLAAPVAGARVAGAPRREAVVGTAAAPSTWLPPVVPARHRRSRSVVAVFATVAGMVGLLAAGAALPPAAPPAATASAGDLVQYGYAVQLPAGWAHTGGLPERRRSLLTPATAPDGTDLISVERTPLGYDADAEPQRARAELRARFTAAVTAGAPLSAFDADARFAGRPVVSYREASGEEPDGTRAGDVDWYVVLAGDAQLSVGCRHTPAGTGAVGAACATVVGSLHRIA